MNGVVQTARGCPIDCNFCAVAAFNGTRYRMRSIDDVLTEVRHFAGKTIFFADDNLVGYGSTATARSLELFTRIAYEHLNVSWFSQASINVADNPVLLSVIARSGGLGFFIGFESLDPNTLRGMNKGINVSRALRGYEEKVKRIHDAGLGIVGGFIFGNAGESLDVFDITAEFIERSAVDGSQYSVLTPFPGTRLWAGLDKTKLLRHDFPEAWSDYDAMRPVFYNGMDPEVLSQKLFDAYSRTNSPIRSVRRAMRTVSSTHNLKTALFSAMVNYGYYTGFKAMVYQS